MFLYLAGIYKLIKCPGGEKKPNTFLAQAQTISVCNCCQSSVEVHVSSQHSLFIHSLFVIPISPHELPRALPSTPARKGAHQSRVAQCRGTGARGFPLPGACICAPGILKMVESSHLKPPSLEKKSILQSRVRHCSVRAGSAGISHLLSMELAQAREKRKRKKGEKGRGRGKKGKGGKYDRRKDLPFFLSKVICAPGMATAQCLKQAE